jgi:hypothetical protein
MIAGCSMQLFLRLVTRMASRLFLVLVRGKLCGFLITGLCSSRCARLRCSFRCCFGSWLLGIGWRERKLWQLLDRRGAGKVVERGEILGDFDELFRHRMVLQFSLTELGPRHCSEKWVEDLIMSKINRGLVHTIATRRPRLPFTPAPCVSDKVATSAGNP